MKIAVFVSGRGSNLKAFLDENPLADVVVFSNKKNPPDAFKWARRRGVRTELRSLQSESDWTGVANELNEMRIKRLYLLGFMKIVPEIFLNLLNADCVNLHPSILPDFPGLKSIERSFEAKKAMGCSVHAVVPEVDAGELYLQKKVVDADDSLLVFEEQVHQAEQDAVSKYHNLSSDFMEAV